MKCKKVKVQRVCTEVNVDKCDRVQVDECQEVFVDNTCKMKMEKEYHKVDKVCKTLKPVIYNGKTCVKGETCETEQKCEQNTLPVCQMVKMITDKF